MVLGKKLLCRVQHRKQPWMSGLTSLAETDSWTDLQKHHRWHLEWKQPQLNVPTMRPFRQFYTERAEHGLLCTDIINNGMGLFPGFRID